MGHIADLISLALRKQSLASKAALAREIGCTPSRLAEWAAGGRPMPLKRLMALAELAGRDPAKAVATYLTERPPD
jgi:transcriptional regulator with XRE-family HTH domain